jgi:hypothetical protein
MKPAPITAQEVADAAVAQEHLAWSPTLLVRYSPNECIVRSPERAYVPRGPVARGARHLGNSILFGIAMYADVLFGWFVRKREFVAADALILSIKKVYEEDLEWNVRGPAFFGVWLAVGPERQAAVLLAERVYLDDGPSLNIVTAWRGEVQAVRRVRRRLLVSFTDRSAAWLRVRTNPARWFEPSPVS